MRTYFQDNPFWKTEDKTEAMSIYVIEHDDGRVETKQQPVPKVLNGDINPLWTQLMNDIGPEKIDANTVERKARKSKEHKEQVLREEQNKKSTQLEELFGLKIKAFEIKEVRECSDRTLRTKLRASKNEIEMNAWITAIFLKSLEETNE